MENFQWYFLGIECPNCGNDLKVLTDEQEINDDSNPWVNDSDDVKCCECEFKTYIILNDNGDADIDEGNIEEIEDYY